MSVRDCESREAGPTETIISDSPVNQPSRNASLVFDLCFSNMKASYAPGSSIETPSVSIVSYGSILCLAGRHDPVIGYERWDIAAEKMRLKRKERTNDGNYFA